MGQNNQQQQQTVPGVRIDLSNVRGNTRFSDLHEDLQKEIQAIDDFIQKQISFKETIDESMFKNDENIRTLAPDVNLLAGKADTVELALDNDAQAIKGVRELVQQDAEDAKLSFRAIENLKLPPQFHYQNGWRQSMSAAHAADDDAPTPPDLVGYFSNRSDALDAQLRRCTEQVAEIEAHLQTIEASTMAETEALMMRRGGAGQSGDSGVQGKVRELARTMKLFEEAIMKVATRVGGTREEVVELVVGNGLGGANGGNGNGSGGGFGSPWASRSQIGTPVSRDRRAGWS